MTKQNRYTIKHTNGYWKVFDTENYTDVSLCYLESDAKQYCKRLNKGK